MTTTEELLELEDSALLERFDGWLTTVASSHRPPWSADHADIKQEGRLAMWRALSTYDGRGALPSWLTRCARTRMQDIAAGRKPPTGHEPLRGHREPRDLAPLPDPHDAEAPQDIADPRQLALLEQVEWASARGRVQEVLAQLSAEDREYVVLRFWGGIEPRGPKPSGAIDRAAWTEAPRTHTELAGPQDHCRWEPIRERLGLLLADVRDGYGPA